MRIERKGQIPVRRSTDTKAEEEGGKVGRI